MIELDCRLYFEVGIGIIVNYPQSTKIVFFVILVVTELFTVEELVLLVGELVLFSVDELLDIEVDVV